MEEGRGVTLAVMDENALPLVTVDASERKLRALDDLLLCWLQQSRKLQ